MSALTQDANDEINALAEQLDINLEQVPLLVYTSDSFLTLLRAADDSILQYRNYQPPSFTIPSAAAIQADATASLAAYNTFSFSTTSRLNSNDRIIAKDLKLQAEKLIHRRCIAGVGHFASKVRLGFASVEAFLLLVGDLKCSKRVTRRKMRVAGKFVKSEVLHHRFKRGQHKFPALNTTSWHEWCVPDFEAPTAVIITAITFSYVALTNEITLNVAYNVKSKTSAGWINVM